MKIVAAEQMCRSGVRAAGSALYRAPSGRAGGDLAGVSSQI